MSCCSLSEIQLGSFLLGLVTIFFAMQLASISKQTLKGTFLVIFMWLLFYHCGKKLIWQSCPFYLTLRRHKNWAGVVIAASDLTAKDLFLFLLTHGPLPCQSEFCINISINIETEVCENEETENEVF